ncbi:AraC family transcriptional regulator [Pasteurellaceae bacterium Pebbles2]|nr:AraC family transcriptional regulator [Pasteurellaceae bacterium Pebbles2]
MDVLDHLIQLLQIKGEVHTHCLLQGNWEINHPPKEGEHQGVFHLILQGEAIAHLSAKQIHLKAGDIFFLPKGLPHDLHNAQKTSKKHTALYQLERHSAYQTLANGKGKADLEMFCGAFYYAKQSALIENFPDYLHFSLTDTPIMKLIELFKIEAQDNKLAAHSIINSLSQVLFTYILRNHLAHDTPQQGILAGLQDRRLNNAISAILNAPQQPWHVEMLAQLANMSRANFIRVFQQKIGTSPAKFLTSIRLQKAAQLLLQTQNSVLAIALDVGYQSEAHFSKTFKSVYGLPPSQYRKESVKA